MCPAGFAVTGIFGTFTGSINALAAHCTRIGGGASTNTAAGGTFRGSPNYDGLCPDGTAATGFFGRSGGLVDQLTLRCQLSFNRVRMDGRDARASRPFSRRVRPP
jgi:hypothetical protein